MLAGELVLTEYTGFAVIIAGLLLGGVIKGATGAGLPVIAVPVIAAFYDVRLAVVLILVPNFLANVWQVIKYREHNLHPAFTRKLALWGLVGAAIGTVFLAYMPSAILRLFIASIIVLYIGLRLLRPQFALPMDKAEKLLFWVGCIGGLLQGSIGISAPVAITFLNAAKFIRPVFILTSSVFFCTMCIAQFVMQIFLGLMSTQLALVGTLALVPIMIGLQMGDWVGKKLNREAFDRITLVLLGLIACKMIFDTLIA